MDELEKMNTFFENGQNHECSCLTDFVFKNIDYTQFNIPVSFFRSDFSRSKFYSCTFYRNSFGRADFIDVYFENVEFNSADFGSCLIKNALLENVKFTCNHYRGVAIQYTYFKNCVFRNEDFITNMYHCSFYKCIFICCTFKKSSLDSNEFTDCKFTEVDLSECIAESLKFDNCALRDVFLGASLWTTYLYRNTDIRSFGFKYRGQVVDIWNGNPKEYLNSLLQRHLYFEYLNSMIISDLAQKLGLIGEIKYLYPKIISQPPQIRRSTMIKILDMLLFYRNYYKIPIEEYLKIYFFFAEMDWKELPFEEALIYDAKLYKIRKSIECLNFDLAYVKGFPPDAICISKFHINCDDTSAALEYLETAFDIANHDIYNEMYMKPLFKVIQAEKGSVILTLASAATLALLVSYVAKKVSHNIFSIQIENGIKKQIVKQLKDQKTSWADIKKSCELAQKINCLPSETDTEQINRLSSELTKGEILDIFLNLLI